MNSNYTRRNKAIDYGRFIFAFLIVVIHVPILFPHLLIPIARCGVPYFFLVTGYYLYTSNRSDLSAKLRKNIYKWALLWLKYTLILTSILFILKLIFINENEFKYKTSDIFDLLINGTCRSIDVLVANNTHYGISTLWFLYAGFLSFIFLLIFHKYLNKIGFKFIITLIYTLSLITNYFSSNIVIYRFIAVAIPFIYMGYCIKEKESIITKLSSALLTKLIILFIVFLYIESFYIKTEIYISTAPLTVLIFMLFIKKPNLFRSNLKIPVYISMDIYIWHRLFWILTSILFIDICGIKFYKWIAAVVTYF